MSERVRPSAGDKLPPGCLLSFYGDDFTGSTDALDAMAGAGLSTVLFLRPPNEADVAQFQGVRCVGLAGTARSQSPAWMRAHLGDALRSLLPWRAPILQYKVCSTFDSSPEQGSIGCAVDIGAALMPGRWSPMVVAAPHLGRYQMFGHLFARVGGVVHRLDRHPTMSQHPVTPMREADLRLHLALQTARRVELIDWLALQTCPALAAAHGAEVPVLLFDGLDGASSVAAGRLIWEGRGPGLFSASSSGLNQALVAYWRACGLLPPAAPRQPAPGVSAIAVASGSCSPVTAAQIQRASTQGFELLRLDLAQVLAGPDGHADTARLVAAGQAALRAGRSPLFYSALGPQDPAVAQFEAQAVAAGLSRTAANERVAQALGAALKGLLHSTALPRVAVAGGDTSGAVVTALGLDALTVCAALAPGVPLCRAWAPGNVCDGLELALKGGQMGPETFFASVRDGASDGAAA